MINKFLYIFLFIPTIVFGQIDSCDQFKIVIDYLKNDLTFKTYYDIRKPKLKINAKVSNGISSFLTYEYIAGTLGFSSKEQVFSLDTSIIYTIARQLLKEEFSDTNEYLITCISELGVKKNANIYANFCRKGKNIITIDTGKIQKKPRHTYGMIYLFFLKDNFEIDNVFKTTWIE